MPHAITRADVIRRSAQSAIIAYATQGIQYLVSFGTQVTLARMLDGETFGALAFANLISVFFNNLANTHGDKYLVQSENDVQKRLNNVFTLELVLSLTIALIVLVGAPALTNALGKSELARPVQFLVLTYLANPLSQPRALFVREIFLLKANLPSIAGQIAGSLVGITLAYRGCGLWSLLWFRVSAMFVEMALIWVIAPYRPEFAWNKSIIRGIIAYGWPLMGSALLTFFSWNIDYYLVGSLLGTAQLGYYWLAYQMANSFLQLKNTLNSVLFPAFSRLTDANDRIKAFDYIIRATSAVYTIPAVIMIVFGHKLIPLVFGAKWEPAVGPFQVFFVVVLLRAISGNAAPLLYSLGRTRQDLILSVLGALMVPLFVYPLALADGIRGAALGVLFCAVILAFAGFHCYITPLSRQGIVHYFGKPLAMVGIAFGLLMAIERQAGFASVAWMVVGVGGMVAFYYLLFWQDLGLLYSRLMGGRRLV